MGAFCPFLSGRGSLRAAARRCDLGEHRVGVVLGQAGLAERAGGAVAGYRHGMRQRLGVAGSLSKPAGGSGFYVLGIGQVRGAAGPLVSLGASTGQ
jgi:hypothetical protein